MSASYEELAHDKRLMAQTAAAMFGGATVDAAIEGIVPGDPSFAIAPALAALVLVSLLLLFGPRLPRPALAMLGPVGVLLIAAALAATPGAGDGAILYVWPVLWTTFFFGPRGGVAIVCFVGLAHAGTLLVAARGEQLSGPLAGRDGVRLGPRRRHRDARAAQPRAARRSRERGQNRRAHGPAEPARLRRARRDRADTRQARRQLDRAS